MTTREAQRRLREQERKADIALSREYGRRWRKLKPELRAAIVTAYAEWGYDASREAEDQQDAALVAGGLAVLVGASFASAPARAAVVQRVQRLVLAEMVDLGAFTEGITRDRIEQAATAGRSDALDILRTRRGGAGLPGSAASTADIPETVARNTARATIALRRTVPIEIAEDIASTADKAMALGRSPDAVVAQLEKAASKGLARLTTWPRTEAMRAYRGAAHQVYARNSSYLSGWWWRAVLDNRTCLACFSKHGSVHPWDEYLNSHPNCRCVAEPLLHDDPMPVTGEQELAAMSEEDRRSVLGPAREKRWNDGVPLEDMLETVDHPVYGSRLRVKTLYSTPLR